MFRLENKTDKSAKRDLFITVAGNVGAGKSTLTKLVGEKLDFWNSFWKSWRKSIFRRFLQRPRGLGIPFTTLFLSTKI